MSALATVSTFLSGKVRKHSLPVLTPPTGPDAPVLKRLLLGQGELAQFHDADDPIRYLAYLELREGTVRGNHFHEVKEEFVYLIAGELRLVVEDLASGARDTIPLQAGDLVFVPKRVAHALQVIKSGQAIEYSAARFDGADTYRHPLV
jgi:mannose-6-phosphate isomerase-like protein (cupin superfamily)